MERMDIGTDGETWKLKFNFRYVQLLVDIVKMDPQAFGFFVTFMLLEISKHDFTII